MLPNHDCIRVIQHCYRHSRSNLLLFSLENKSDHISSELPTHVNMMAVNLIQRCLKFQSVKLDDSFSLPRPRVYWRFDNARSVSNDIDVGFVEGYLY